MAKHLTEKENALRAMTRSGDPEWVPVVADCISFVLPADVRERPPHGQNGRDWFGCNWLWDDECLGYAPDLHQPYLVRDISSWRECVTFPDLDAIDWETSAARDMEGIDREEKAVRILLESGPFERSHHILGFEGAFTAMYDNPVEYKALINAITDYKVKLIGKLIDTYKPDEIFAQDDLGHNQGPMFSLEMYREFIKPAHIRISEAIRSRGVIHTHHSCGCMEAFIDDLLEVGVQVLNPIQPCNNRKMITEKYSGLVSFEVGADFFVARENSTEEQIRAEVREVIDLFGPHKNMVLGVFPSNKACLDKIDIAFDEARSYGAGFYK